MDGNFHSILETLSFSNPNDLLKDAWISPTGDWLSVDTTHADAVVESPFWFKITPLQISKTKFSSENYEPIYRLVIPKGYIRFVAIGRSVIFDVFRLNNKTSDIIFDWYQQVKDRVEGVNSVTIFEWYNSKETDIDFDKIEDFSFQDIVRGAM